MIKIVDIENPIQHPYKKASSVLEKTTMGRHYILTYWLFLVMALPPDLFCYLRF